MRKKQSTALRQTYPLPREYVVMLEQVLAKGLQDNPAVGAGIKALCERLKVQGPYIVRLSAVLEPAEIQQSLPND